MQTFQLTGSLTQCDEHTLYFLIYLPGREKSTISGSGRESHM